MPFASNWSQLICATVVLMLSLLSLIDNWFKNTLTRNPLTSLFYHFSWEIFVKKFLIVKYWYFKKNHCYHIGVVWMNHSSQTPQWVYLLFPNSRKPSLAKNTPSVFAKKEMCQVFSFRRHYIRANKVFIEKWFKKKIAKQQRVLLLVFFPFI